MEMLPDGINQRASVGICSLPLTTMVKQAPIWDLLKAETLRSMCRDLGFPWLSNRDAMQTHLQIAFKDGNSMLLTYVAFAILILRSG